MDYDYASTNNLVKQQEVENSIFSEDLFDDIMNIESNEEEECMAAKFYNFQCINLYAYIDYAVARQLTNNAQLNQPIDSLINTPLELYESPYMAKVFASNIENKQLMVFAIWVQDNIFDMLDLQLKEKIKVEINKANGKSSLEEIKKSVAVIRSLKKYKVNEKSKAIHYISYTVQNQNAIKAVYPL